MPGTLSVPNTFASQSGNVPAAQLDTNYSTIATYVNAREVTVGTIGARPAFGTAGRWYLATDVNGGTLYVDTGSAWTQAAAGVSAINAPTILSNQSTETTVTGTVAETLLKTYTVPGATLTVNGDLLRVTVGYRVSADAFTKRFRLKFGATTIADSTATFSAGTQAVGILTAYIMRTGAATQRTEAATTNSATGAAWSGAVSGANESTAPGETLSGAIVLQLTVELSNIAAAGVCDVFIVEKLVAV